jgi:hypothetical protein
LFTYFTTHCINMAPSATETITLPTRRVETSTVKLTSNNGPYKELAPIGYEKEAEEQGKDGFAAAKVCLELIARSCSDSISTKTISHIGKGRNVTLLSSLSSTQSTA